MPPFPFGAGAASAENEDDNAPLGARVEGSQQTSTASLLSDFAGIDMPGFALDRLTVDGQHYLYEVDKAAARFLEHNHTRSELRRSMLDRVASACEPVDIVVAGFPCQPFSMLGGRGGVDDARGRGTLVEATLDFVNHHRPSIVVLENVTAF